MFHFQTAILRAGKAEVWVPDQPAGGPVQPPPPRAKTTAAEATAPTVAVCPPRGRRGGRRHRTKFSPDAAVSPAVQEGSSLLSL